MPRFCKTKQPKDHEQVMVAFEAVKSHCSARAMKVGASYWTLILRSQTHHAIMFGDKQGFVRLYCESSGEAVKALIRPQGAAVTPTATAESLPEIEKHPESLPGEEAEVSKVGQEVVMTEFESAILHLLEKLRPKDSGETELAMLIEWIEAFQLGCMHLDFVGQTHSVAFKLLEALVSCRTVKFEVLSEALRDVDAFRAATTKGSLSEGEPSPFHMWLCSNSDGLRLVGAARKVLDERAEESKFLQELNGLKSVHDDLRSQCAALSACAPVDDAFQKAVVGAAGKVFGTCEEMGKKTFPKGMRKEILQLRASAVKSLSEMVRVRMQSSLASGLSSIVAASGSNGFVGAGKLLNLQQFPTQQVVFVVVIGRGRAGWHR